MSLADARSVDKLSDRIATVAMAKIGQCIQQYVPSAMLNVKYPLSPKRTDQFIATPVTAK